MDVLSATNTRTHAQSYTHARTHTQSYTHARMHTQSYILYYMILGTNDHLAFSTLGTIYTLSLTSATR